MLLAIGILLLYAAVSIGAMWYLSLKPPTPDPSPGAIRVVEYLRKGRR